MNAFYERVVQRPGHANRVLARAARIERGEAAVFGITDFALKCLAALKEKRARRLAAELANLEKDKKE